ncbi:MAG: DNA polymerase III subunit delta' [Halioglobus sp.]|nr:DNA polymerase III subunit delta' [Halioglobus sp.]
MDLLNLPAISTPLPWHEQEWALLHRQLGDGQLAHALLLVGRQHTGKQQLAMALSRLLLCAQPRDSLNCGECHACQLSGTGAHGDFLWVAPVEKSRVIKIDQVREVVRFTSKTAGFGVRKVIVLAPAESMNVNAFNALLKSLEEPAQDTHLLLVCDNMHGVPATIRSRCQILHLPTPGAAASLEWLDRTTGQRAQSEKLLALSDGLPLLAAELYCSGGAEEFAARRQVLPGLIAGRITVAQASALWEDLEMSAILEQFSADLQRLLVSLPKERLPTRQGRTLFSLLDEVSQLQRAVSAGSNPGKQLLLEALMSKVRRGLGADLLGDSIPARTGDPGP